MGVTLRRWFCRREGHAGNTAIKPFMCIPSCTVRVCRVLKYRFSRLASCSSVRSVLNFGYGHLYFSPVSQWLIYNCKKKSFYDALNIVLEGIWPYSLAHLWLSHYFTIRFLSLNHILYYITLTIKLICLKYKSTQVKNKLFKNVLYL